MKLYNALGNSSVVLKILSGYIGPLFLIVLSLRFKKISTVLISFSLFLSAIATMYALYYISTLSIDCYTHGCLIYYLIPSTAALTILPTSAALSLAVLFNTRRYRDKLSSKLLAINGAVFLCVALLLFGVVQLKVSRYKQESQILIEQADFSNFEPSYYPSNLSSRIQVFAKKEANHIAIRQTLVCGNGQLTIDQNKLTQEDIDIVKDSSFNSDLFIQVNKFQINSFPAVIIKTKYITRAIFFRENTQINIIASVGCAETLDDDDLMRIISSFD